MTEATPFPWGTLGLLMLSGGALVLALLIVMKITEWVYGLRND